MTRAPLRIALADQDAAPASGELARALTGHGHVARLVSVSPLAGAEALLARRGFTTGLSVVPRLAAILLSGRFDVVHAFSVADAAGARLWSRLTGGTMAFTCREVVSRATVADRRLRLALLRYAVGPEGTVLAASAEAASALARWLAVEATVLAPGDAAAHTAFYRATGRGQATG